MEEGGRTEKRIAVRGEKMEGEKERRREGGDKRAGMEKWRE